MANNLTAVIGADNTGLIKSVSQAKTLLEQYQKTAKGASTEIRNEYIGQKFSVGVAIVKNNKKASPNV